ncbi:unnamed protein product [Tetraodon nigroviridis]|uniref:(spotted green pufferfish) hypothetical protein n=1 Tax=Tetraodon nigroviridis TaxID=99883 RepID=Q4TFL2_TETNG|nr:unnamed protein product [Tetraodon nigroviridis]
MVRTQTAKVLACHQGHRWLAAAHIDIHTLQLGKHNLFLQHHTRIESENTHILGKYRNACENGGKTTPKRTEK